MSDLQRDAMNHKLLHTLDRAHCDVVLIVDDVPDNVSLLHDALDESGYTVLVALDGPSALQRAAQARPDIVLLDAMMPGMDGFEVARRLKADAATAHIPIIFMTGLTETEHLVAALEAGGSDYVTKPIKPQEVLARMQVHLRSARERRQARNALDAFGYASVTLRLSDGRLMWQTPLARALLRRYGGVRMAQGASVETVQGTTPPTMQETTPSPLPRSGQETLPGAPTGEQVSAAVLTWLQHGVAHVRAAQARGEPLRDAPQLKLEQGARRLTLRLQQDNGDTEGEDWLVILQEESDEAVIEAIAFHLRLTAREAEVLYWVVKGKINRDIGDILGSSPMTVKKHLERIYAKLGVETRTAAAAMAMSRVRLLQPQFKG